MGPVSNRPWRWQSMICWPSGSSNFTPVGNLKTDDVIPEREADLQVGNMKFRHDFGPTRFRRSVPVGTHIDNFLAVFLSVPFVCTRKLPHSGVTVSLGRNTSTNLALFDYSIVINLFAVTTR